LGGKNTVMTVALALALSTGLANADFASDMRKANAWDYTGQRNVAYALTNGDGTPQNVIEGCAWRVLVVFHRGADVTDSDIISLQGCFDRKVMPEAVARSKAIAASLPKRPLRTAERDLADLRVEDCSDTCSPQFKAFEASYRAAVRGDVAAVRRVSECFSEVRCGTSINLFQACLWTHDLIRFAGEKEAALRSRRTVSCGSERVMEFALAHHQQELKAIRSLR
jgi:hypothetical protein